MSLATQVDRVFPAIASVSSDSLRQLVHDLWAFVSDQNPKWTDLRSIPLHPSMPIAQHGNLVSHVVGMARVSEVLVPLYEELWQQELDLDTYLAACYIHDAAKVIEFVERDGAITALPGFNHALEAGRIVRWLGGPEDLAHMVECHSFAGPLTLPRTRDAQLFLFLDPLCLNVFPEQGPGAVERHLKANGWEAPKTKESYRSPL